MCCCLDERLYPKLLRGATYGSCWSRWVKYWSSSHKCMLCCKLLKLDYSVGFEENVRCATIEIATLLFPTFECVGRSFLWFCFFLLFLLWEWDQRRHHKRKCINLLKDHIFFHISLLNSCLCLYLCPCPCPCLHVHSRLCLYLPVCLCVNSYIFFFFNASLMWIHNAKCACLCLTHGLFPLNPNTCKKIVCFCNVWLSMPLSI